MTLDVLLVGGGLANGLIAWLLAERRPELTIRIYERGETLGGNHTWSFHDSDLDAGALSWVVPLVTASWTGYDVVFPNLRRSFSGRYHSIRSADFHDRLLERLGDRVLCRQSVGAVEPNGVSLADGTRVGARCVIDGRGWRDEPGAVHGYQRFLGQDLELAEPHGIERPVIMDATVEQTGGYRFFYLLPWNPRALLVEDTLYGDAPAHDDEASRRSIGALAQARGWRINRVLREERGVLPIPLVLPRQPRSDAVPTVGVRGGFFHPTTGYSLPYAVRVAELIAALPTLSTDAVKAALEPLALALRRRQGFLRLLNRMLFWAADPAARYRVLERFHRLPEALVERFYADRLTVLDQARLTIGRPPVPVVAALSCLAERPR